MIEQLAALMVMGGVAELDRTSVFHGLLSEPIVLSPLVGYVLGDPMLGLKIGALLQLFFLGMASMGGSSPPDGTLASVAVTAAASLAARYTGVGYEVAMTVAVLIVMVPAAWMGKAIDTWIKESNVAMLHKTEEEIESKGVREIEKAVWKSVAKSFLIYAVATGVISLAGVLITSGALAFLPGSWSRPLEITGGLLLLASAGIALASLREKRALLVYAGVGLGLLILIVSVG